MIQAIIPEDDAIRRYAAAVLFLKKLRQTARLLNRNQVTELRLQALSGDVQGAYDKLDDILADKEAIRFDRGRGDA